MKDKNSSSSEENTSTDSTMSPLEAIEQRVADGAEQRLMEILPSLMSNCISTDPGVRSCMQQNLQEETNSSVERLKKTLDAWAQGFRKQQERLTEVERQNFRTLALEQAARVREFLKKMLQILTFATICLAISLALVLLLPPAVQRLWEIWQQPNNSILRAENQRLQAQVTTLLAQPSLRRRVILYPRQNTVWAEVEPGTQPELTTFLSGSPERDRVIWLIRLKEFQPHP
jgi:hypothetical protein